MAGKVRAYIKLSDSLTLTEAHDGFWLWDETRKMNLAMRVKTERAALLDAIAYYQNRLATVEKEHSCLTIKVNSFLEQFNTDTD